MSVTNAEEQDELVASHSKIQEIVTTGFTTTQRVYVHRQFPV